MLKLKSCYVTLRREHRVLKKYVFAGGEDRQIETENVLKLNSNLFPVDVISTCGIEREELMIFLERLIQGHNPQNSSRSTSTGPLNSLLRIRDLSISSFPLEFVHNKLNHSIQFFWKNEGRSNYTHTERIDPFSMMCSSDDDDTYVKILFSRIHKFWSNVYEVLKSKGVKMDKSLTDKEALKKYSDIQEEEEKFFCRIPVPVEKEIEIMESIINHGNPFKCVIRTNFPSIEGLVIRVHPQIGSPVSLFSNYNKSSYYDLEDFSRRSFCNLILLPRICTVTENNREEVTEFLKTIKEFRRNCVIIKKCVFAIFETTSDSLSLPNHGDTDTTGIKKKKKKIIDLSDLFGNNIKKIKHNVHIIVNQPFQNEEEDDQTTISKKIHSSILQIIHERVNILEYATKLHGCVTQVLNTLYFSNRKNSSSKKKKKKKKKKKIMMNESLKEEEEEDENDMFNSYSKFENVKHEFCQIQLLQKMNQIVKRLKSDLSSKKLNRNFGIAKEEIDMSHFFALDIVNSVKKSKYCERVMRERIITVINNWLNNHEIPKKIHECWFSVMERHFPNSNFCLITYESLQLLFLSKKKKSDNNLLLHDNNNNKKKKKKKKEKEDVLNIESMDYLVHMKKMMFESSNTKGSAKALYIGINSLFSGLQFIERVTTTVFGKKWREYFVRSQSSRIIRQSMKQYFHHLQTSYNKLIDHIYKENFPSPSEEEERKKKKRRKNDDSKQRLERSDEEEVLKSYCFISDVCHRYSEGRKLFREEESVPIGGGSFGTIHLVTLKQQQQQLRNEEETEGEEEEEEKNLNNINEEHKNMKSIKEEKEDVVIKKTAINGNFFPDHYYTKQKREGYYLTRFSHLNVLSIHPLFPYPFITKKKVTEQIGPNEYLEKEILYLNTIMKYYPQTLRGLIIKENKFMNEEGEENEINTISARRFILIMIDIASGLQYLHKDYVVHRDLKPDNILISETGKAIICDFGLAKIESSDRVNTVNIGNQVQNDPRLYCTRRGEKYGCKSDVFPFVVIMMQIWESKVFTIEDINHDRGIGKLESMNEELWDAIRMTLKIKRRGQHLKYFCPELSSQDSSQHPFREKDRRLFLGLPKMMGRARKRRRNQFTVEGFESLESIIREGVNMENPKQRPSIRKIRKRLEWILKHGVI